MKNLIVTFILFIYIVTNGQVITDKEKADLISLISITTIDSIYTNNYATVAVNKIIDYMDYNDYYEWDDAVQPIIDNIWKVPISESYWFLSALSRLNVPETEGLALDYIDSLNATNDLTDYLEVLDYKLDATSILFEFDNYSTYGIVLETLDYDEYKGSADLVYLFSEVLKRFPNEKDRIKDGLIRLSTRKNISFVRNYASDILYENYGDEMLPFFINILENETDYRIKQNLIGIFVLSNNPIVVKPLENELSKLKGVDNIYNLERIIHFLLYNFQSIEHLKLITSQYKLETDYDLRLAYKFSLKSFKLKPPDSSLTTSVMVDTLLFYLNKSYEYNWLKDLDFKDELQDNITKAKTFLTNGDSTNCYKEITAFNNKVNSVYNDSSGSYPKYVSLEGWKFLHYYSQYILDRLPEVSLVIINSLSGKVSASVSGTNNLLKYNYTITNSDTSSQGIENIYVTNNTTTELTPPTGWLDVVETFVYNLAGFNAETETDAITAGNSKDGFTISTNGLPSIGNIYLQSQRSFIDSTDIFDNSYVVTSVVPKAAPLIFEPIAFVDTMLSYNNSSLDNGWLSAAWVRDVLKSSLDNARLMLLQNLPQSSLPIMQQFNAILESYKTSNFVTDEGYYLLKFNSDYLITKLDSMINTPPSEAVAQLDTIYAANELNKTNLWYSAEWVYTVLTSILNNARITLDQNNLAGTKLVIQQFIITLDSYKTSGFVTAEGYNNIKPKCLTLIDMLQ